LTKYLFRRRVRFHLRFQSIRLSVVLAQELNMIDFTGQVAVVTGAGRGLGRLYALDLAHRGASVVVNDLGGSMRGDGADSGVADEVVDEIKKAGGTAIASYDSVDSPGGGQAIIDAGIFGSVAFEDLSVDDWTRMLRVHLDGGFFLSQPAYRAMRNNGGGRFVFISSSAGIFGQPMEAHYAAAKAGLVGLTNVIAIEGEAHGILANSVMPTGFSRMVTETVGDEKFLAESGFMRAIRPELVVPLVTFLASSSCTFSHRNYSSAAGRYARVFVGLSEGWLADAESEPTAEDIEAHLEQMSSTAKFSIPTSIVDEVLEVCERRGVNAMPGQSLEETKVAFPEPQHNRS
jgi:NAD(P)-dependent dehydrogenase (short-subunit alcohol dehydrogenase family)